MATAARDNGYAAFICGAGMAAHLAGVVAAHTTLPVRLLLLFCLPLPPSAAQVDSHLRLLSQPAFDQSDGCCSFRTAGLRPVARQRNGLGGMRPTPALQGPPLPARLLWD
jgi:hypothetical protein